MYRTSMTVDPRVVRELCDMMVDWPWIGVCTNMLSMRLCGYGVGIFHTKTGVEIDMSGDTAWVKWLGGTVQPFVSAAVAYLACLGFVVYETDTKTGRVHAIDPRELIITMYRSPDTPVEYSIRRITDLVHPTQHGASTVDTRYRIYVMDQPEIDSGMPTGWLMSLRETFRLSVIIRRNMGLRDTQNAYTMYGLEAVPGTHSQFSRGPADTQFRQTDPIHGYAGSIGERADEEEEARERMFLHTGKFVKSMDATRDPVQLTTVGGRIAVSDYDPSRIGYFRAPPDMKLVARAPCQALPEFVATMLHFEREVFCRMGVPYSIVEHSTGNHANALDTEREVLGLAVERYILPVNKILDDLCELFVGDDSVTIRARISQSEHGIAKLYENGAYTHEAFVRFHATRYNCAASDFGEDPRPLPPAAAQRQKIEDEMREEARTIRAEQRAHRREDSVNAKQSVRESGENSGVDEEEEDDGEDGKSVDFDDNAKQKKVAAKKKRDEKASEGGKPKERMNGPGHHGKMTLSTDRRRQHQKTRDPTSSNKR